MRGLVSRTGLLVEKAGLAAICSLVVTLLMLAVLELFVDLDWGRFPLWLAGIAAAALAFAAMGLAIGALTQGGAGRLAARVHALAADRLPRAGAVRRRVGRPLRRDPGGVGRVPVRPTLDAMNSALNGVGGIGLPLLHLALLFLGFGAISRLALRRFV